MTHKELAALILARVRRGDFRFKKRAEQESDIVAILRASGAFSALERRSRPKENP